MHSSHLTLRENNTKEENYNSKNKKKQLSKVAQPNPISLGCSLAGRRISIAHTLEIYCNTYIIALHTLSFSPFLASYIDRSIRSNDAIQFRGKVCVTLRGK